MTPRISIVIPTYSRRESLRACLDSLAGQAAPPPFEVIVVDDGSTDGTAEMLAEYDAPFPLHVISTERAGPAAARNLGARQARGEYLLFLDDDIIADPGLLAGHLRAHEANADMLVIGPMLTPKGQRLSSWTRWEQDVLHKQYEAMIEGRWRPSPRQFYTANASLPLRIFLASGGFDPEFKRAEDVELAFRLRDLGLGFLFQPGAVVFHYPRRSLRAWWRIPYQYGIYDVRMWRDKGRQYLLRIIAREFSQRHPLVRRVVSLCGGGAARSRVTALGLVGFGVMAGGVGVFPAARWAYSLAFNTLYFQGLCEELGSVQTFRSTILEAPPLPAQRAGG